jgi:hypothetical protein
MTVPKQQEKTKTKSQQQTVQEEEEEHINRKNQKNFEEVLYHEDHSGKQKNSAERMTEWRGICSIRNGESPCKSHERFFFLFTRTLSTSEYVTFGIGSRMLSPSPDG